MPVLHMQTESVSDTAAQLQRVVSRADGQTQELRSAMYRLQNAWEGSSQYDFTADLTRLLQSLDILADSGNTLVQRLQTEVNEWLQTDSSLSGGPQAPIGPTTRPPEWPEAFDWLGWTSSSVGFFGTILELQTVDWKNVGRAMNWLIGNQRGGWVGRMDEFGRSIQLENLQGLANNKWLGLATDGIPLGLDIWTSSAEEGWSKAIGSETIEFFFEKGMYAIPVVGQLYMAYDLALDGAGLVAGGLEMLGFEEQAVWLQNTAEQLDIGEYIGDWGYDFLAENVAPNLDDAAEAVVDFGAGFVDGAADLIGGAGDFIGDLF
ncbi:MAG: hypothetical protein L0332_35745 [Chloroflexi bacterium]|nr:hypothetical protein [Chloroflexota bacterium]